jgi:multisubunit Na+/H+ antiporter MnhE subunit
MLRAVTTWFLLAVFYLALAAKPAWPECCVAAVAATIGWELIRRLKAARSTSSPLLLPPIRWLAHVLASVWTDGWRVMAALLTAAWRRQALHGSLDLIEFSADRSKARDAARRTWVTLGLSLAPATVVIAADRARQRLLVHRLPAAGERPAPAGLFPERIAATSPTAEGRITANSSEWPT